MVDVHQPFIFSFTNIKKCNGRFDGAENAISSEFPLKRNMMRVLTTNYLRLSCCTKKTTVSNSTHSTDENDIFPNDSDTE